MFGLDDSLLTTFLSRRQFITTHLDLSRCVDAYLHMPVFSHFQNGDRDAFVDHDFLSLSSAKNQHSTFSSPQPVRQSIR
jgi:hypothetical protein